MSRGGRGGGRGGRRGPDLAWDDEQSVAVPFTNKPEPLFPDIYIPIPRPLETTEISAVDHFLSFRDRIRQGPYFSNLDPSGLTDDKGKVDQRAGFDPFNDQETFSRKSYVEKRSAPDLSRREYALEFFPRELWAILDPKKTNPKWKTRRPTTKHTKQSTNHPPPPADGAPPTSKRKRPLIPDEEDDDLPTDLPRRQRMTPSLSPKLRRRPRRGSMPSKSLRQKPGLDAEDDYPDVDQDNEHSDSDVPDQDDDEDPVVQRRRNARKRIAEDRDGEDGDSDGAEHPEEEEGDVEGEPVDSEFEESDDGQGDDYNAENYFDTGEGDDEFDGGGGFGAGSGGGRGEGFEGGGDYYD